MPQIIWDQFVNGDSFAIDLVIERLLQLNSDDPTLQFDHNPTDHLLQYIILSITCLQHITICNLCNDRQGCIQIGEVAFSVKLNNLNCVFDTASFVIILTCEFLINPRDP